MTEEARNGFPRQYSDPTELGFNTARLNEVVAFARTAESPWPKNLESEFDVGPRTNELSPWNEVIGKTKDRGDANGLILRYGGIAARWGDVNRVDMSFSLAKAYLSLLAGVAVTRGLIRDIDEPMRNYALDSDFDSPQNRDITWRHLLQQTSEWEGTLFGKPDLIDRNRQIGPNADNSRKGSPRPLSRPGRYWEYNDVRVNRLSLSLLQVFGRPLQEILDETLMAPMGASRTWAWVPYGNSWVSIDGQSIPSVPGGSHWGGGLFMSTADHARTGHLVLNRGRWDGRQLIDDAWFELLTEPCPVQPTYGFLWWLNTDRAYFPSAPSDSIFAVGAGQQLIWVTPSLRLVVVARWVDNTKTNDLAARIVESIC